jgi:hypothetical protein
MENTLQNQIETGSMAEIAQYLSGRWFFTEVRGHHGQKATGFKVRHTAPLARS